MESCWPQLQNQGKASGYGQNSLPRLYDGPRQINDKKLEDLLLLLDYIPPVFHSFYQELSGCDRDDEAPEEVDLSDSES